MSFLFLGTMSYTHDDRQVMNSKKSVPVKAKGGSKAGNSEESAAPQPEKSLQPAKRKGANKVAAPATKSVPESSRETGGIRCMCGKGEANIADVHRGKGACGTCGARLMWIVQKPEPAKHTLTISTPEGDAFLTDRDGDGNFEEGRIDFDGDGFADEIVYDLDDDGDVDLRKFNRTALAHGMAPADQKPVSKPNMPVHSSGKAPGAGVSSGVTKKPAITIHTKGKSPASSANDSAKPTTGSSRSKGGNAQWFIMTPPPHSFLPQSDHMS